MPLAPVSNIVVGTLTRKTVFQNFRYGYGQVYGNGAYQYTGNIGYPTRLDYEATITWTNNEQANHFVEVRTSGTGAPATVHLATRNATTIRIPIQQWASADNSTASRTVSIHINLKTATEESAVTTVTRTISLTSDVGSIPTDPSLFALELDSGSANAGSLLLPPHSGLRLGDASNSTFNYGNLNIVPLGTTRPILAGGQFIDPLSRYATWQIQYNFGHDDSLVPRGPVSWSVVGPTYWTGIAGVKEYNSQRILGLVDGGFYKAIATFTLARTPLLVVINSPPVDQPSSVSRSWLTSDGRVTSAPGPVWSDYERIVEREAVFEYWSLGFPRPRITSPTTITAKVGDSIFYTLTAASPVGVVSYGANVGSTGLTYNSITNRITGSFSTAGTRTITVSATNSYGTGTATVTIAVDVVTPVITSPLTASAVAGVPFDYIVSATNATSFSVNLNSVPGISYNAGTRRITGAFTSGGVKSITLTASNSDATTTQTLNVTVAVVQPAFTSALTADNVAGTPFTYTLAARDATAYSVDFGAVSGLTYDEAARRISGVFTAAGTYNVAMTASNPYASTTLTLVIVARVVAPLIGRYVSVTSLTRSGTTATAVCSGPHGLVVGGLVNVVGTSSPPYNGTFTITAVTASNAFQYMVIGSPATPALPNSMPDGILAGPGALTIAARAGDDFNYEVVATNATATAVNFGTSTGLSYSPETRRITGDFTSLAPVQTLQITASNLLANTTRDLTVNVTIPVPMVTSALQVRAIAGQQFLYVLNTVDATSVAVTNSSGLTYNASTRTLSGVFAESQAGQQVVAIALANEFSSKNEQLVITVEVPRLQDPQNVAVTLLHRVWAEPGKQMTVYGNDPVPPAKFDLYGLVSWRNTEPRPHNVILTVAGRRTTRPSGSTDALVYLATWTAPEVAAKTINIGVQLTGTEFSSTLVTANVELNGGAAAAFPTGNDLVVRSDASFDPANALLVPAWTGSLDRMSVITDASGSVVPVKPIEAILPPSSTTSLTTLNHLGNVVYDLADDPVSGSYYFVSADKRALALPTRLLEGELYRAELTVATGAVQAKGTTYQITWEGMSGTRRVPPQYVTRQHYNVVLSGEAVAGLPLGTALSKSIYFNAPASTALFKATTTSATAVINRPVRVELLASLRATWTIDGTFSSSGASVNLPEFGIEYDPPVFGDAGPERAYLVGTPSSAGVFRFTMTARNGSRTASATVTISVVASLPRTTISTNSTIAREGWKAKAGDELNLAFISSPPSAQWTATGLPPGVRLNQDGTIIGRFTRSGTYLATIGAQGLPTTAWDTSLPTTIKFVIEAGDGTLLEDYSAAARSPWLLAEWQLIDLHVLARSREVQSTMFEGGALRIKVGDALNFGIFFVDAADSVFALGPTRLRLTIRKADNLEDLMIFKSAEPPVVVESNLQTYYQLNVTTGGREREVALEWAEENEKNEPLKCVADLDWVMNGKNYSSRTFPVLLELDVTRP